MYVDQIAIAIFGLVLALACGMAENKTLQVITSIGSILFYLFILYTKVWQIGAKDRLSVDCGHEKKDLWVGLKMSLISNSLNFLLAIGIMLGVLFSDVELFSNIGGISSFIALLSEGMYIGLISLKMFGAPLNSYFITFFIIIIPALVTCLVGYIMGYYHIGLTKLFAPPAPKVDKSGKEKKY
jgi:hypothetical protein